MSTQPFRSNIHSPLPEVPCPLLTQSPSIQVASAKYGSDTVTLDEGIHLCQNSADMSPVLTAKFVSAVAKTEAMEANVDHLSPPRKQLFIMNHTIDRRMPGVPETVKRELQFGVAKTYMKNRERRAASVPGCFNK